MATPSSRSSTDEPVLVGEILKAHGLRGQVAVRLHTDNPRRFQPGATLLLGRDLEGATERVVATSREHRGGLLVSFEGLEDLDSAKSIQGLMVFASALPSAEGSFLARDLVGMEVVDRTGGRMGVLRAVHIRDVQDLWEVETPRGERILLPAVEEFIDEVDVTARRIVAMPPEGLFPPQDERP